MTKSKINQGYARVATQSGWVSQKALKSISPNDLSEGRVVIFRDPARSGFPDVEPEVGIAYKVMFGGKNNTEAAFLYVLPVTKLSEFIKPQSFQTVLSQIDRKEKADMGLNPNYNYVVGHFFSDSSYGAFENSMRVIPVHPDVFDFDEDNKIQVLGHAAGVPWEMMRDKLDKHLERSQDLRKHLLTYSLHVLQNKDNPKNIAIKPKSSKIGGRSGPTGTDEPA